MAVTPYAPHAACHTRHPSAVLTVLRPPWPVQIDECNGRFISARTQPFQFLDVCCCPGGFSTYTLTAGTAPRKGIGLSLNPELGGHLPAIPEEVGHARFACMH